MTRGKLDHDSSIERWGGHIDLIDSKRKKIMDTHGKKNFELKVDNVLIFAVVGMLVVGRVAREVIKKA